MKDLSKSDIKYIRGAGGGTHTILGQILLPIRVADVELTHRFYVIDQLGYNCLFGIDFLQQNKVQISYENNTVTINHMNKQVAINMISEPNSKARLRENSTIPPGTIRTVAIHLPFSNIDTDRSLLLTPTSKLNDLQIGMLECIIAPVNNTAWVQLANFTSEPIQIYKKTPIANIEFLTNNDFFQVNQKSPESANVCFINSKDAETMSMTAKDLNTDTKSKQELKFDLSCSNLTNAEKEQLAALLHEYQDCFSTSLENIGKTSLVSATIETKDEIPVRSRAYKTSAETKIAIEKTVQELMDNDIVEYSSSNYASPVILVKKPNGTHRLVVDYRKLNEKIKDVAFPLPLLSDIVDQIGTSKSKYFSVLDLRTSFHQVNLGEEARHKSAFICHHGLFQFKRMPMGLKSSSFVQQFLVNELFKGLSWHILLCYVDDILIHSPTFEQHLAHLRLVFDRLRSAHLTLSLNKCVFSTPSVKFLGNIFTKDGIFPCKSKTAAIDNLPAPKSQKEVKRFLGVTGYYRRYIPSYSKIAYPLFKLLSKENAKENGTKKFIWSDEADTAFRLLKQAQLKEPILLHYPDVSKQLTLRTDGSKVAISYALMQEGDDGLLHPICYGGKSLRKEQRNWPILHIELYAILLGIREYRSYLVSKPFKVITDCRSLQYLKNMALTSGKLARWNIELMQYNFTIEFQKGSSNNLCDMLSRRQYENDDQNEDCQTDCEQNVLHLFENNINQNTPDKNDTHSQSLPNLAPTENVERVNAIHCENAHGQTHHSTPSDISQQQNKQAENMIGPGELLSAQHMNSQVKEANTCNSDQIPSDIPEIMQIRSSHNADTAKQNHKLDIPKLQQTCPELAPMYNYLSKNVLPQDSNKARAIILESSQYHLLQNKLYHVYQNRTKNKVSTDPFIHQLVVPKCLRKDLLFSYHDSPLAGCHLGFQRVYQSLRMKYYWKGLYNDTYLYVTSCSVCQEMKRDTNKRNAPMKPLNIEPAFAKWHLDYLSVGAPSSSGNKYILVAIEAFTHMCEVVAMKSQSANAIAQVIYDNIITRWGVPSQIHTDNDNCFQSKIVKALCDTFHIRKVQLSTYHPQSNSVVERFNQSLLQCLRTLCATNPTKWDTCLSSVMMAYRMSPSLNSTGFSPFYLVTGTHMKLDIDYILDNVPNVTGCIHQYVQDTVKKLKIVRGLAKLNMRLQQSINKARHDLHSKIPTFAVGQRVYLSVEKVPAKSSRKLYHRYSGPFYIIYKSPNHSYKLRNCQTHKILKYPVHATRLKVYRDPRNFRTNDQSPLDQLEMNIDQPNPRGDDQPNPAVAQDANPNQQTQQRPANVQNNRTNAQSRTQSDAIPLHQIPDEHTQPKRLYNDQTHIRKQHYVNQAPRETLHPPVQTESRTRPPEQNKIQHQNQTIVSTDFHEHENARLDPPISEQTANTPGNLPHDGQQITVQTGETQQDTSQQTVPNSQNLPQAGPSKGKHNTWYPAERLLKSKLIRGIRHYLVRWVDKSANPSWEPSKNVTQSLIENFNIEKYKKSRRKGKRH